MPLMNRERLFEGWPKLVHKDYRHIRAGQGGSELDKKRNYSSNSTTTPDTTPNLNGQVYACSKASNKGYSAGFTL